MSDENKAMSAQLTPEDLDNVGGGASDYSMVCGESGTQVLGNNCFFCTRAVHSQYEFKSGLMDTIGCGLSPGFLGNIDGCVLVNQVPTKLPQL